MTEWLKGRILATNIREKVANRISKTGKALGLGVILVGDDPASELYVGLKEQAAKEAGIFVEKAIFTEAHRQSDIEKKVQEFNKREDIHGILVQLPLPEKFNEDTIIATIHTNKDVDGFKKENLQALLEGKQGLVPPVALAIMRLIQASHQPLRGKSAIIVSNNDIFSKPIIKLMEESGITGQYLHPDSSAFAAKCRVADILVVAIGRAGFINEDMIKEGSIVIDVGTNRVDGKVRGDIARSGKIKSAFASPVPGGVGPLTVAYLLLNVLKVFEIQKRSRDER